MKENSTEEKRNSDFLLAGLNGDYATRYGFSDKIDNKLDLGKGLSEKVIREISRIKQEDEWMLAKRLDAYLKFKKMDMPKWGPRISDLNFDDIHYFIKASNDAGHNWEDVPEEIKRTFDKLGIPQAERKFLAGVATQYESEVIYHNLQEKWKKLGVVFLDTDKAYKQYPELFHKYYSKIIPATDNKFAALNSAAWSGGSFIYIPKGVQVKIPLQAYFRINTRNMGQFERTLIIADEGSQVHYIEGCTAPIYSSDSLHAAVVEVVVLKNARVRYTTIQNWSTNVYNLVTKRALVRGNGIMEWVDCNLGSKVTMKYPSVYLTEPGAHGEVLSIALANKGQVLDAGAKAVHIAPRTSSIIQSRSICLNGGRTSYRGLLQMSKGSKGSKSNVICDALILDDRSQTDTYPTNVVDEADVTLSHEASVSKISEEQLFYLKSRGLKEDEAAALIVAGFIEPIMKELPMEYAAELNALINMNMEGSVG